MRYLYEDNAGGLYWTDGRTVLSHLEYWDKGAFFTQLLPLHNDDLEFTHSPHTYGMTDAAEEFFHECELVAEITDTVFVHDTQIIFYPHRAGHNATHFLGLPNLT